ncbi:hypothetical protein [Nitrosopumilus ureiphilus]|uniref:Uncharacterized protein n=1 Tax=Nitrosopumilus ureiphilus TaxID=1470067 RepID=A0A7D5R1J8_9ARCH|nr:hypothetical protein [Nitrosopumilus ureiphilus]QLH06656.1 hypothetical protein C5F50_05890 [Nitrosopumilus ureiphilus]
MKTRVLIPMLALSLLASTTALSFGESSDEYALGIVEWQYDCHPLVFNTGLIRITDPDMNIDDDVPDRFDIEVLSDYNENNIQKYVNPVYTVIETGDSTGVFETVVFWGDPGDEGIGHRVPIWDNVTVTAKYTDHTLPLSYLDSSLDITSSIIVRDVKPIEKKNSDGISGFYYVYEPCTVELLDMKNDPKYTVNHDFIFLPPLKQIKSGIAAKDVICKEELHLVKKNWKENWVCVKNSSMEKLTSRNYIYHSFGSSGVEIPSDESIPRIPLLGLPEIDNVEIQSMIDLFENRYHTSKISFAGSNVLLNATHIGGKTVSLVIQSLDDKVTATLTCNHMDWRNQEVITENVLDYLKNVNCFNPSMEETGNEN